MTHRSSFVGKHSIKIVRSFNLISFMILNRYWSDINFLNLGYIGNTLPFNLDIEDEKDINSISLYIKTFEGMPENTESVLEIGSGLGGGCYLLKKYYKIPVVIGIDYAKLSVKYSNNKFSSLGINFYQNPAEEILAINKKVDVILSLEASQIFYNWELFFKNVTTLLKNDGTFLYCDIFAKEDIQIIEELINTAGLMIIHKEDISSGVIDSINSSIVLNSKESYLYKLIKKILFLNSLEEFKISNNSKMYHKLVNNELIYIKYIIKIKN